MPITTSSPFVTEELVFYDDFSTYSLGSFTGGGVYTPWTLNGSHSYTIESGNILRGVVTAEGHGGFTVPAYFRNGRVRIKTRHRQSAGLPDPDNEQSMIWMRGTTGDGGILARTVSAFDGVQPALNGHGITTTFITLTPNTWYILEMIVRGPTVTANHYSEAETLLESQTAPHGHSTDTAGVVRFSMAYDQGGSVDFDWIEVYKLPY